MKTVILCGGKGTRLKEHTQEIPKALIEIGNKPIIWHIMKLYSYFGHRDFILCLGYKGEKIEKYALNSSDDGLLSRKMVVQGKDRILNINCDSASWSINLAYTGLATNTGGRIKKIQHLVGNGETFFATYGDGLADVNINALLEFHRQHGKIATLVAATPVSQFGILHIDHDGVITRFEEKPRSDQWINGGFFVFNQQVFDYLEEGSVLEKEPLERLARDRQLIAFKHSGFWVCMDTYKDTLTLNELWESGNARWKIWPD